MTDLETAAAELRALVAKRFEAFTQVQHANAAANDLEVKFEDLDRAVDEKEHELLEIARRVTP